MTDATPPPGNAAVPHWWYAAVVAALLLGCLAVVLLNPDLKRQVNVARATAARAGVAAALAGDPRFADVRSSVDRTGRGGLLVRGTVTHRADLNALLTAVRRSAGTVPTTVDVIVAEEEVFRPSR